MRIIQNESDYKNKFGDTNTVFRLNLYNDETLVDTTNKSLKLNIANDNGLVLSKDIKTDYSGYIAFDFSDPDLQKLTPDHYLLEYEYTLPDGDVAKYPTTGGLAFTITSNLKETNGRLVSNITFDEVLTAVDEKIAVYLATVKKGDKGDTGDTGATGQNGIDGKNGQDSDVMQSKDNTFTGNNTFTGKNTFTQPINGALNTRPATFTDFSDVAKNMIKYSGNWAVKGGRIENSPVPDGNFMVVEVIPGDFGISGKIIVTPYDSSAVSDYTIYYAVIKYDGVINWKKIAKDDTVIHNTGDEKADGTKTFIKQIVASGGIKGDLIGNATTANDPNAVHKTGDETVSGNKSFTGNVSIGGSVMNYTNASDLRITGFVSGWLRVSKQSGIVSITSMDLILTKGATFTLPDGYYPRVQLQAPITGQNSSGKTEGGYMTIGIDGSVTFNSMGFASGNATAYVNVNYIAQI